MKKIKLNKALQVAIETIKNNTYTEEIFDIPI